MLAPGIDGPDDTKLSTHSLRNRLSGSEAEPRGLAHRDREGEAGEAPAEPDLTSSGKEARREPRPPIRRVNRGP